MVSYEELDKIERDSKELFARLVKAKRGKMAIYRLARISGISESQIRRIEAGNGCNIGAAKRLCEVLNLTVMIL